LLEDIEADAESFPSADQFVSWLRGCLESNVRAKENYAARLPKGTMIQLPSCFRRLRRHPRLSKQTSGSVMISRGVTIALRAAKVNEDAAAVVGRAPGQAHRPAAEPQLGAGALRPAGSAGDLVAGVRTNRVINRAVHQPEKSQTEINDHSPGRNIFDRSAPAFQ
jgi:hypothetical protein